MASLKQAIADKCKDCTYDKLDTGTWRDQVERCNVKTCALWPVRPMTVATINIQRKTKSVPIPGSIDINAVLAGLEDDDETVEEVA